MSSDLVSPTSGWIISPSVTSSATLVRYSWARWMGLRVWKPTTRRQPFSAKMARLGRRATYVANGGSARAIQHVAAQVDLACGMDARHAGMRVLGGAEDLLRLVPRVVGVLLGQLQDAEQPAGLVAQRDLQPICSASASSRPTASVTGIDQAGIGQAHGVDHRTVVRLAHEAGQRAEGAVPDQLEVGAGNGADGDGRRSRRAQWRSRAPIRWGRG